MCDGKTPTFRGLRPKSARSSRAARGSSPKKDSRCELALRRELWIRGLRYRLHLATLPGRPDLTFVRERVAVFCDGDFWHGRDLPAQIEGLLAGHNATYWVAKIARNAERDAEQTRRLQSNGWVVLRFWETDILSDPGATADRIAAVLREQRTSQMR